MIGCGVHAKANIFSSLHMLGQPIQAVCARHLNHAQAAATQFGIARVYDDYFAMIKKENLDAMFVVVEAASQAKIVCDCLHAGLNVFVEKPLGMDGVEAMKVADLSSKCGKSVMLGFMKRFSPSYNTMKDIMGQEEFFGKKLSFMGMFAITSGRPGWDNNVFTKVGGIHYVDLMRYLFGELVEIHGYTNSMNEEVSNIFTMRFDSGVIGSMFFCGIPAWKRHWEEICVSGTRGFVKVDNMMSVRYHFDIPIAAKEPRWTMLDEEDRVLTAVSTSSSGGWRDLYLNGYAGEIKHFLECLREGKTPICDAHDNVKTMTFCDQIVACLKS
jgi:predicted dehydrogenase